MKTKVVIFFPWITGHLKPSRYLYCKMLFSTKMPIFFHRSSSFHKWGLISEAWRLTPLDHQNMPKPILHYSNFVKKIWPWEEIYCIRSKNFFYKKVFYRPIRNLIPDAQVQNPKFAFYHPTLPLLGILSFSGNPPVNASQPNILWRSFEKSVSAILQAAYSFDVLWRQLKSMEPIFILLWKLPSVGIRNTNRAVPIICSATCKPPSIKDLSKSDEINSYKKLWFMTIDNLTRIKHYWDLKQKSM